MRLRLGNWETAFLPLSQNGQKVLQHFQDEYISLAFEGVGEAYFRYFLVGDGTEPLSPAPPPELPEVARRCWGDFHDAFYMAYRAFNEPDLNPVTVLKPNTLTHRSPNKFSFIWSSNNLSEPESPQSVQFYTLILRTITQASIRDLLIYSLYWATLWHSERKGVCLHSSALAQGDRGYLFLGNSNAGKSTVAQLGTSIGLQPLGDDFNFLLYDRAQFWRIAGAPSPKLSTVGYDAARPKLLGIFKLIQSSENNLIPLSQTKTARALYDSLMQTTFGAVLPAKSISLAFDTIAAIARMVPGYELHFRKSTEFWDVIEAELGHGE